MSEPIPFTVTRYRCPCCPRTGSSKARVREHIGRCWHNPDAKGCKTCKYYEPGEPGGEVCFPGRPCNCNQGEEESCAVGVSLSGNDFDIKPGPIVGCEKWEAADVTALEGAAR